MSGFPGVVIWPRPPAGRPRTFAKAGVQAQDEFVDVGAADVHGRREAEHVTVDAAAPDHDAVFARGFHHLKRGGGGGRFAAAVFTSSSASSRPMPRTSPMSWYLSFRSSSLPRR